MQTVQLNHTREGRGLKNWRLSKNRIIRCCCHILNIDSLSFSVTLPRETSRIVTNEVTGVRGLSFMGLGENGHFLQLLTPNKRGRAKEATSRRVNFRIRPCFFQHAAPWSKPLEKFARRDQKLYWEKTNIFTPLGFQGLGFRFKALMNVTDQGLRKRLA